MLLYYIRHGDPIYDPSSLTPLGETQAVAVAKRLAVYGIDKIFSSPSGRAYLTAKPTADLIKKEITTLDFTDEAYAWKDFTIADSTGKMGWLETTPEALRLLASEEMLVLGYKWYEHPKLKDYNYKAGVDRVDSHTDEFLLSLGYRHDRKNGIYEIVNGNDDRVALFAHGGFGGAFISSVLGIPYSIYVSRFSMSHSAVTVIEFRDLGGFCVPKALEVSTIGHLYKEGLPTKYNNRIYI